MTTNDKNIAIQELKDAQQAIETLEAAWTDAYKAGKPTEKLDAEISRLISRRHGMESLLTALGVEFDRKDYRTVGLTGEMECHTMWFLI